MPRSWYVLFGHPERRRWEDARAFGFVSGGGGRVWSRRLRDDLRAGDRVYVHIPTKAGGPAYAGIGTVTADAVRAEDFLVGGQPLLDRDDLVLPGLGLGDDDVCEWIVAVRWDVAVDPRDGYWRLGLPRLLMPNVMELDDDIVGELEAALSERRSPADCACGRRTEHGETSHRCRVRDGDLDHRRVRRQRR